MKTFNEILQSSNLNVQDFESHRLQLLAERKEKSKKGGMIGGGILFVGLLLTFVGGTAFLIGGFVIGLIVFFIVRGNTRGEHAKYVKSEILKKMIENFSPDFVYEPAARVSEDNFKKSEIVKGYTNYSGEDRISGKFNEITFDFSELLVEQKQKNSTTTLFNGPFYVIQSPKAFNGKTAILPDTAEKLFGGLGTLFQKMNLARPKVIKIDDTAFEKEFVVYSSDENEARAICSPDVIAFLMERKTAIKNIYLSCVADKIYFGMYNNADLFPVDINKSIDNTILESYYNELVIHVKAVEQIYNLIKGVNIYQSGILTDNSTRFN
jgi:hypothetical protein